MARTLPPPGGAFGDRLRHVSYFLSGATRSAFWDGACDLVPTHFSEMPQLLRQSLARPLVLAAASPPDRHGYFSLGTNADYVAALILGGDSLVLHPDARSERRR